MKENVILTVAVVCGIGASALGFKYLSDKAAPPQEARILVASRPLSPGEKVQKKDVAALKVPQQQFASLARQAYGVDDIDELLNREIHRPVPAGAYITRADTTPIVDLKISHNMVALGVSISAANSLSQHLIQPGDNIDIYVLREERTPPAAGASRVDRGTADFSQLLSQVASESTNVTPMLALRGVRVLAVGNRLSGSREQFQLQSEGSSRVPASNDLTVEVTRTQLESYLKEWGGRARVVVVLLPREERSTTAMP